MTGRGLDDLRIRFHPGDAAAARWRLAAGFAAALMLAAPAALAAGAAEPISIAVFDFVLEDRSAGAGLVAPDPIDAEHLAASTAEARRRLEQSGRYGVVDTSSVAEKVEEAGGVRHCDGCDAALARELGAEQSMIGIITRVTRTEYTLQIVVRDAASGEAVSNSFTGLRMGANYAWPRGVKWLMENQILAAEGVE